MDKTSKIFIQEQEGLQVARKQHMVMLEE